MLHPIWAVISFQMSWIGESSEDELDKWNKMKAKSKVTPGSALPIYS